MAKQLQPCPKWTFDSIIEYVLFCHLLAIGYWLLARQAVSSQRTTPNHRTVRNLRNVPLAILAWLYAMLPAYPQEAPFNRPNVHAMAIYQEGIAHIDSTEWAAAAAKFREATTAEPQMKDAWYNLAFTYYQVGDFLETERVIEKLLSIDPFYEKAYGLYGMALYYRGDYPRAIKAFNYAVNAQPKKDLQVARAICFIAQGNYKYALPDLDNVLYDDPGHTNACLAKSAALIGLGQHAYALRFLNRILDNDPENVTALTNRAICHFQMGNHSLANADFDTAIWVEPKSETFLARATCYLSIGQFKAAVSDVKAAMKLCPDAPEVYYVLGKIEMGQAKYGNAMNSFDVALSIDHTCMDCLMLKSEAEAHISNFGAAIKDIYTVLKTDPNNEQAREMLLWVYSQIDRERGVEK